MYDIDQIARQIESNLEHKKEPIKKIKLLEDYYFRLVKKLNNNFIVEPSFYKDDDYLINSIDSFHIPEVQNWIRDKIIKIEKNKFLSTLKWKKEIDILKKHFKQLSNEKIISYKSIDDIISGNDVPVVVSKSPYVDIICLFKFWEKEGFIIKVKHQWKRIAATFINNDRRQFDINQLRSIYDKLKPGGYEDNILENKLLFFKKILK